MTPPRFLIGQHPDQGELWAAIDTQAHHLHPGVRERRFAAYLSPYPSEEAARHALIAAGAMHIEREAGRKRGR